LVQKADLLLEADTDLDLKRFEGIHCVLVDEAQFISEKAVEQLRDLTRSMGIPVICYGLRTDFKSRLFPASKRLLELADSIEEIKVTCAFCNSKGVLNLKQVNGQPLRDGPTVQLGAEELYLPVCYGCYAEKLGISGSWQPEEACSR
jgi:thymidine kinase